MTYYLNSSDLINTNKLVVKQAGKDYSGMQYPEGLSVIIEQPKQILFEHELYPTIWLKASFILQKIAKKHLFIDGNKRTAVLFTARFLEINDCEITAPDKDFLQMILYVATHVDDQKTMQFCANWLKQNCKKISVDEYNQILIENNLSAD